MSNVFGRNEIRVKLGVDSDFYNNFDTSGHKSIQKITFRCLISALKSKSILLSKNLFSHVLTEPCRATNATWRKTEKFLLMKLKLWPIVSIFHSLKPQPKNAST